ncbi:MAG TPA: hypothetical protein VJY39_06010 [Acidisphaera sp.]|nr:hypothetical protein [Acidisphaera sp.]
MHLEIPEGAHAQIVIDKAPYLALPDETAGTRRHGAAVRPMIRAALAGALLCGAFVLGKQLGPVRTVLPAAASASQTAGPAPASGGVPPEFVQQLQQRPTLAPPPGQPPPPRSRFGLEH